MSKPQNPPTLARLSELAPEVASTVVRVAGDIALVVGDDGVIRSVAENSAQLHTARQAWVGQPWADTVATDTRQKVALLLHEAQLYGVSRRRELNHHAPEGGDIPVSWAAVRLGENGPVLAVGRDLRAVSAIQQRFLDSQQDLERDYWQRRQTESHYRKLFDVAHDAVLVLDAEQFTVREANPAATALFERSEAALNGQPLRPLIEPSMQAALDELLITTLATGHAAEMRLRVAGRATAIDVSATPFSADGQLCLLLRARHVVPSSEDPHAALDFIDLTPDAVVVTDIAGRVQWANPAFVTLCEAPDEQRIRGRGVAEVLGDEQQQWSALLTRVRARGVVGHATVLLQIGQAPLLHADVSATLLADGEQEQIGFTLRLLPGGAAPALAAADDPAASLTLEMQALAGRVGLSPLPELMRQATRSAELHFIQSALRQGGGRLDVASTALGLSTTALLDRMGELGISLPAPTAGDGGPPLLN